MLSVNETNMLKDIESKYYLQPILKLIKRDVDSAKVSWSGIFDRLYQYTIESKVAVDALIEERVNDRKIRDASQARKSIAGNAFSNLIIYTFLKNKAEGTIAQNILISAKISQVPYYKELFYIKIGEESQKPDVDLVIYSLDSVGVLKKCLILSLKTSLRERATQTYKWKLLMEIAYSDSKLKEKYDIVYDPPILPLVCFATINFYNEIDRQQQRGMFKFFAYGDSKTTVAYGQFSTFINEWLGFKDARKLDTKLLGGLRSKILYTKGDVGDVIQEIAKLDLKRALEVSSFYYDLEASIKNILPFLAKQALIFFVVGNRRVKNIVLPTNRFIVEVLCMNGCRHISTIDRKISNKSMPLRNSPTNNAGIKVKTMDTEKIIVCRKK